MQSKNIVLVPGAWLGAWVWKKIIPLLEKHGYNVYPVTLTGMGERRHLASKDINMETAIQDVLNIIEYNDLNDIILAGHSFAGKVVSVVADRIPEKIKLIMYIDAVVPENVRTPQGSMDPESEFGSIPPGFFGIPLTDEIIEEIGSDVKGKDRDWMLKKGAPWPIRLGTDPIVISDKFDAVKKAYIFCIMGHGGKTSEEIYQEIKNYTDKLTGPYKIIETGHWPMVTKPEELVKYMIELSEK